MVSLLFLTLLQGINYSPVFQLNLGPFAGWSLRFVLNLGRLFSAILFRFFFLILSGELVAGPLLSVLLSYSYQLPLKYLVPNVIVFKGALRLGLPHALK